MASSYINSLQKSPSKGYRSKNYVLMLQNIRINPEKTFQQLENHPNFKCEMPSCCDTYRPLVRVKNLVPNVIYNVVCTHYDYSCHIQLVLNNIMVPATEDDFVFSTFAMYDGKKIVNVKPEYSSRKGRYCFCETSCKECICFSKDAIMDSPEFCECLTECRVITFDLDRTLQELRPLQLRDAQSVYEDSDRDSLSLTGHSADDESESDRYDPEALLLMEEIDAHIDQIIVSREYIIPESLGYRHCHIESVDPEIAGQIQSRIDELNLPESFRLEFYGRPDPPPELIVHIYDDADTIIYILTCTIVF